MPPASEKRMPPTAEKILADMGEPIYGLAAASGARITGSGYSGGAAGRVVLVKLHFAVRRQKGGIDVETSLGDQFAPGHMLFDVVVPELISLEQAGTYPLRIDVDRGEARIAVDNGERLFTTYTCRNTVAALSRVEDRWIRVRCPINYLPELTISSLDRDTLETYLTRQER